ncbi:MAG TPA: hypothetical protein VFD84_07430 [Candidatus Binatia bacterium]|jgi:hypothetical protein|nr:hypothetical protein [Candidatus Binatia bacterium]
MSRLEQVDGQRWRELVAAPLAVLVLGKSDCPACAAWSEELEQFLATDGEWRHVRFGKVLLDKGGLIDFKRANPWIAELDVLPFTQIWARGERAKGFAGGGVERLVARLRALTGSASAG